MKRCPQCHSTYTDDTLNFCLQDGTALESSSAYNQQAETLMLSDESNRALVDKHLEQVVVETGSGMGGGWIKSPNLVTVWRKLNQQLRGREVIELCNLLEEAHDWKAYWKALKFLQISSQQQDDAALSHRMLDVACDHIPEAGYLQEAALELIKKLRLPKEKVWESLLVSLQITEARYAMPIINVIADFTPPAGAERTGEAILQVLRFIKTDSYREREAIAIIDSLDYRKAAPSLRQIMVRKTPETAAKIAALLAKWNDREAIEEMRKCVEAHYRDITAIYVVEILKALYRLEGSSACPYIAKIISNSTPYVQKNLPSWLGELLKEPVIIDAVRKINETTRDVETKKALTAFLESGQNE